MKKLLLIVSLAVAFASCNNYGGDDDDYGWKDQPKAKDTTQQFVKYAANKKL